jgi:hypothetical protein
MTARIELGAGICPSCARAGVKLIRFRGSTTDSRDGSAVIGKHRVAGNEWPLRPVYCAAGYMQRPAAAPPAPDTPETAAEKARQARSVMDRLSEVLRGGRK